MAKWYTEAVQRLQEGHRASVRPYGRSMEPLIKSGEKVELVPCTIDELEKGDVVLCKVGTVYLHLVKDKHKGAVLIGNNRGGLNGWTVTVYGKKV